MKSAREIYNEIKTRKMRKWLTIYTSSILTLLGVINLFSSRYDIPGFFFDIIVLIGILGLPSVILISWLHGKEGMQKINQPEFFFHSVIFILMVVFTLRIVVNQSANTVQLQPKSIAVLPFENLSDSKEDQYFTDGIMEDLLTQLSKISDFDVISRISVMKYKDGKKSIKEIGAELGVENILEGSVRRAGNIVRIVSQLIDVNTDRNIWSETYDRELKDIFKIQSEIAQQIALTLKAKLSSEEKQRIDKKATDNLEAYGLYLRGREYYNTYKKDDNENAIELFKKAIELDRNYTLAYAGLADAYAQRTQRFGFDDKWIDSAITISNKAIMLDPGIAEPYKALGLAYALRGWFRKSLEEYYNAIKINPNLPAAVTNVGNLNLFFGNYAEAYKWLQKGLAISPGKASSARAFGYLYACLIQDDLSEKWYLKTLELQSKYNFAVSEYSKLLLMRDDFTGAKKLINSNMVEGDRIIISAAGDVELFSKNYSQASDYYKKAISLSTYNDGGGAEYAYTLLKLGKKAEAYNVLDTMITIYSGNISRDDENYSYIYDLCRINSIKGNKDEALAWLNKAINAGWLMYRWCERDPLLENLRGIIDFLQL